MVYRNFILTYLEYNLFAWCLDVVGDVLGISIR